jgi:hypothetical protein
MTRKVTKLLLVACLIWGMTPGLAVAAENLWHVATTGHAAHDPSPPGPADAIETGDDHAPVDDEHGCSGAFHFCFCHHTLMSAPTPVVTGAPSGAPPERAARSAGRAPSDPVLSGLERPPRS